MIIGPEIIQSIRARTGLTEAKAKLVLKAFVSAISDALAKHGRVHIHGFGTFFLQHRAASSGRNPRTGELIKILPTSQPKFKADRYLIQSAQSMSAGTDNGGSLVTDTPIHRRGRPSSKKRITRRTPTKKLITKKSAARKSGKKSSEKQYEIIRVYYATNRKMHSKAPIKYGFRFSETLSFGRVGVSIPRRRVMATLPRPRWWQRENPRKHITVMTIRSMSENKFFAEVSNGIRNLEIDDIFVFIHGNNLAILHPKAS